MEKYEKPTLIGPIQCLKGTNGFRWQEPARTRALQVSGLKKKVVGLNLREEDWGGNIVNMKNDQVFETNRVGFNIIKLLKEDAEIEEITRGICDQYNMDMEDISLDVNEFMLTVYRLMK